jgi:PKD repeat protein
MGMMTYPFYLLTQQWGVEKAFGLFLESARSCWQPSSEIQESAHCVLQTAQSKGYESDTVIEAFRSVKIKLKNKDTFSHYQVSSEKLRTQFTANPQSDNTVVSYYWEFGDGQTSNEASPYHEYDVKGVYTPKLTIEDDQGLTDSFSRSHSITDEYCAPGSLAVKKREFDSVTINGVNINFDADRYDYSDLAAIDVTAGQAFTINVSGRVLNTQKSKTTWYVRVDINDDGKYSFDTGTEEELLKLEQDDNAYSFNQAITIPAESSGKTLHMRLSGDTLGSFSACSVYLGTVADVRLNVL